MNPSIPSQGESLICKKLGDLQVAFDKVYHLGDQIAEGGFGIVYKGSHVVSGNLENPDVAIKIVERDGGEDDEECFHEAGILRDLCNAPHIIQLIDFYMDEKKMYVVQNFASGGDVLDQLVERQIYTEDDARVLAKILLETLANLHTNYKMVHRDLKPENLLLQSSKDDSSLLLCDFGYTKYLPKSPEACLTTFCGTPDYTAPEIINGEEYREEVDLFSLGCTMFLLLGGYQPFNGGNEAETFINIVEGDYDFENPAWEAISDEAKELITNLLELDPSKRWTACEALQCDWLRQGPCDVFDQTTDLQEPMVQSSEALQYNWSIENEAIHLEGTMKGLRKFCARRKMRAAYHVVQLSQKLSSRFILSNFSNHSTSKKGNSTHISNSTLPILEDVDSSTASSTSF